MPGGDGAPERSESPVAMRASGLLRVKAVWITPIVLASVLIALMTLIYVGSVVDPLAHLSGLPVLVVNEDAGAALGGTQLNLGHEVTDALEHTKAVSNALSLRNVTLTKATAEMNRNAAYTTIVIGKDFTRSTLAVYGLASTDRGDSAIPTIDVVTNPRGQHRGQPGHGRRTTSAQDRVADHWFQALGAQPPEYRAECEHQGARGKSADRDDNTLSAAASP